MKDLWKRLNGRIKRLKPSQETPQRIGDDDMTLLERALSLWTAFVTGHDPCSNLFRKCSWTAKKRLGATSRRSLLESSTSANGHVFET